MGSALKAPLPDGSQLATFAAVLGDATDGAPEGQAEGMSPAAVTQQAAGGFETSAPADSEGEHRGGNMEASSFQPALHGTV